MENGSRLIKEVTTEERASLAAWLLATCVAGTLSISSMMHPLSFSLLFVLFKPVSSVRFVLGASIFLPEFGGKRNLSLPPSLLLLLRDHQGYFFSFLLVRKSSKEAIPVPLP